MIRRQKNLKGYPQKQKKCKKKIVSFVNEQKYKLFTDLSINF